MTAIYVATVGGKYYGFDFADQRIDIDATIDELDVNNLWTAIKEAQGSVEGISYSQIARGSGLNTLGVGIETFLTVTLLDLWEVNTLKVSGKFQVSGGNLIRDDQADPFRDNPLITYIAFLSQAGIATNIETGVSGLTPTESAQLSAITSVPADTTALIYSNPIEGSLHLKNILRALLAVAAGETDINTATNEVIFKSQDGLKDRIKATSIAGERTGLTLDLS